MTDKESLEILKKEILCHSKSFSECENVNCQDCDLFMPRDDYYEALNIAVLNLIKLDKILN